MTPESRAPAKPGRLGTWFHNSRYLLRFLWRYRSFLAFMMRGARRKREIQKVDLKAEDGAAKRPPAEVNLYLTHDCNLRCRMCGLFGEKGIFAGRERENGLDRQLDLEVYSRLFAELGSRPTFYYLSGGEPLLYRPGVANLIREMKKHPTTVALNTNGTLLAEQADDLVAAGLDLLILSIDGPEDVHDAVRGNGAFRRAADGLERVREARRKQRRSYPILSILFTVSRWNYHAVDRLVELANGLGLEMAGLNFLMFTDESRGRASAEIWKRELGVEARSWTGYVIDMEGIDTSALSASYARVLSSRKRFLFYTMPPGLRPRDIEAFYHDLGNAFGRTRCWKSWYRTFIRPNGDVTTCEDFFDCVVGNVTRAPLLDIWNDEPYRQFRRALQRCGHFPFCTRCLNGLYEV